MQHVKYIGILLRKTVVFTLSNGFLINTILFSWSRAHELRELLETERHFGMVKKLLHFMYTCIKSGAFSILITILKICILLKTSAFNLKRWFITFSWITIPFYFVFSRFCVLHKIENDIEYVLKIWYVYVRLLFVLWWQKCFKNF